MLEKIILISSLIATILIGLFVITRDYRRLTNQVFVLMTLSMLILLIANLMTTPESPSPLIFIRIVLLATTVTIACLYMLTRLIIDDSPKVINSRSTYILFISTVLIGLLDISPFAFSATHIQDGQVVPTTAIGAVFFLLHFIFLLLLSVVTLLRVIARDRAKKYPQYRTFLYAIVPILVVAPITSFVLPVLFHYSALTVFTPVFVAYLVGMIAYSMVRHRLFDIKQAAVRSFVYALALSTLSVLYYAAAFILSKTILNDSSFAFNAASLVNVALALLLAFLFQPVKLFFDKITDRIFYRDRYDPEEFFALLSSVLSTTTDMRDLMERASDTVQMTFKSRFVFMFIRKDNRHLTAGTQNRGHLTMADADALDRYFLKERPRIVVARNVGRNRGIREILARNKIDLLLPLWYEDVVTGYVAIGESLRNNYSERDLRTISAIGDELIIAIQNALSLEQVRDVNASLQDRIDTATHSLRVSNDKLRRLDDTKDEFLSMASHQLRTPLTSVKGYISMILDGDAGPITEQQQKFLNEAFVSSNRMAGIIGDFLNVSRLQTGKFSLDKERVNLADIVEDEVNHLKSTAKMRGLVLRYKKPAHFPQMMIDKSKIEQVMMNLIDNAIFYAAHTGSVDIELFQRSGRAVFTVRDHGIGVPKDEQANLFGKFYRATNARHQRPDGTGVGLFLARKVIVAHKGTVIFDSVEGKGSTFGFEIPVDEP